MTTVASSKRYQPHSPPPKDVEESSGFSSGEGFSLCVRAASNREKVIASETARQHGLTKQN